MWLFANGRHRRGRWKNRTRIWTEIDWYNYQGASPASYLDSTFDKFCAIQANISLLDILYFRNIEQSQQANNIQLYKLQLQTNIICSYNLQSSGVSYLVSHHSNYHIDVFHV